MNNIQGLFGKTPLFGTAKKIIRYSTMKSVVNQMKTGDSNAVFITALAAA